MACRAARRLQRHLGRRGTFLAVIGVGKVCWGIGYIATAAPRSGGLWLLTQVAPLSVWAWVWIAAGTITFCSAFLRVGRDGAGFVAALIPPSVWFVVHAAAAVGGGGVSRDLFIAIWYLTSHVGAIMWAASVPEHSVPPPPRRARKGTAP